jgi:hypothetical protein
LQVRLDVQSFFFSGRFPRFVLAKSFNCFSDIDSAIFLEAPLKLLPFARALLAVGRDRTLSPHKSTLLLLR